MKHKGIDSIDLSGVKSIRQGRKYTVELTDVDLNYIWDALWYKVGNHARDVALYGLDHGNIAVLLKQAKKTQAKIEKVRRQR